jgi:hypothetical protein
MFTTCGFNAKASVSTNTAKMVLIEKAHPRFLMAKTSSTILITRYETKRGIPKPNCMMAERPVAPPPVIS